MPQTSYFITGANRGIGLTLVQTLLSQASSPEDIIIFAGARDPSTADELQELAKKWPESVVPLKLSSGNVQEHAEAVKVIEQKVGWLDVVIANAGIARIEEPPSKVAISEVVDHFNVNTVGPLVLYQAVLPLLLKSKSAPKFVAITSKAGSLALAPTNPTEIAAYGASKAALNYLLLKMHDECKELIVLPLHPGMVDTDMGSAANAKFNGRAMLAKADSASNLLKVIASATREESSGRFWNHDGEEVPW